MAEFFEVLFNPEMSFLRFAVLAGILAAPPFGMIGSYVVARRITYIAGAIAHSVLGGIGASLYLQHSLQVSWLDPIWGAIIAAIISALVIGLVSLYAREREDTVIGAIWAVGMAVGILFIAKTPGYIDPMSYLFGNILILSSSDLWIIAGLDLIVIVTGVIFYNQFLAISFDEEFAILRGVNTAVLYLLLLCLTALTIVLLVMIVGIVLVIALLTIPAAIGGIFSRKLWQMMLFATLLCMFFILGGIGISFSLDLPTGAVIIVFAGIVYLFILVLRNIIRKRVSA